MRELSKTRLEVKERAASTVRRGHPWVYRDALLDVPKGLATGATVVLAAGKELLGKGLYDDRSPIAARIYVRGDGTFDNATVKKAIESAFARREGLFDEDTTAYRLLHGEGDRVPGLVVDRYDRVAVVRLDGDAVRARLEDWLPLVVEACVARGMETVAVRIDPDAGQPKIRVERGPEPAAKIDVTEHGMTLEVDVLFGQKTGAFLDQRENRKRVRDMSLSGARVLNLFSYAGGFSIAAALAGAARVVSVDIAAKGHATAQRTFRKNGIDPGQHGFVTADALTHVAELAKKGERFDLVISDPPSFAPNEKSVERALGAYSRLHAACASVLARGGTFCASSCSSHIGLEAFLSTLDDRALQRNDLSVRSALGPPADHPTLAAFPEGRYLKFVELS